MTAMTMNKIMLNISFVIINNAAKVRHEQKTIDFI